jgi:hypothetical protein
LPAQKAARHASDVIVSGLEFLVVGLYGVIVLVARVEEANIGEVFIVGARSRCGPLKMKRRVMVFVGFVGSVNSMSLTMRPRRGWSCGLVVVVVVLVVGSDIWMSMGGGVPCVTFLLRRHVLAPLMSPFFLEQPVE